MKYILSRIHSIIILMIICGPTSSVLQAQTFPGSTGALSDNNCAGSFNTFSATVSNVGVTDAIQSITINLSHTWVSDLNIFLVGPTGTIIELSTGNGGSGVNYVNTVFSDSASDFITTGAAPFTGSFKPEGRANNDSQCNPTGTVGTYTFATQFVGIDPNGNWTLKIKDGASGDIGNLDSWSVTIGPMSTLPKVGINTINPLATLDVNGKIKIGNDTAQQAAGMIRFSTLANDFEGFNGSVWKSMTGTSTLNNRINDADNNTSVDVETNSNENVIRFSLNGTERYTMFPSRIDFNSVNANTFLGNSVGSVNSTGTDNTGLGFSALSQNSTGYVNTGVGAYSLYSNTIGHSNTGVGYYALNKNTNGIYNTAIGSSSLLNNTEGSYNTSNGTFSLQANTTGIGNTAVGYSGLNANTTGNRNSAFGQAALIFSNGEDNTSIGFGSLGSNISGNTNSALGKDAGKFISNGSANQTSSSSIYIGFDTRASQNGNTNEIIIGNGAIGAGSNTVTIGNNQTLSTHIKGAVSYFPMGTNAGETGQIKLHELSANGTNNITLKVPDNIANNINLTLPSTTGTTGQVLSTDGTGTLSWLTPSGGGSGNGLVHPTTGSTFESGTNLPGITGTNNTAIGVGAGVNFISGTDNVMIGTNALPSAGSNNVAIGSGALANAGYFEDGGVAIGKNALHYDERGYNVAVGYEALYHNGQGSLSGSDAAANTAVGNGALRENTKGAYNTAVGNFALGDNIDAYENTAIGSNALWFNWTGDQNTGLGVSALQSLRSGNYNTAVGYQSLNPDFPVTSNDMYNTALGWESGYSIENHDKNTFLGADANSTLLDGLINSTAIGYGSRTTASNQIRVGSSAVTSIGGYVGWSNISDGRFKTNIKEDVHGLDFILNLRPVTYQLTVDRMSVVLEEDKLKNESKEENVKNTIVEDKQVRQQKEQIIYTGFIAQEVDKLVNDIGFDFSGIDKPQNDKSLWGLRYGEFVVPLVKAVQEQQEMIDQLIKENEMLKEYKAVFQIENKVLRENIEQFATELKALREEILNN